MKKIFARFDIIFTILLFILVIPAEYNEWFSTLEDQFVSIRHLLRVTYGDREKVTFPSDQIAIVVTDDAFFEDYEAEFDGGFPFRRSDLGRIIETITFLGAKVVMVDNIFDFKSSYGDDPILAKALGSKDNNLVVSLLEIENGKIQNIKYPLESFKMNTQTAYSNHLAMGKDVNRVRVYPDVAKLYNQWPISIKTAAMYLGVEPKMVDNYVVIGDIKIKLDQFNDFRTDYPGLDPAIKYLSQDPYVGVSAMDLLELDREDEEWVEELRDMIEGKIVFFGDTSLVSHDKFDYSLDDIWGVEMLACEVATLLRGAPLQSASLISEIIVTILFLFLLILGNLLQDPKFRALASLGLLVVYFAFSGLTYIYADTVFSMSYIIVAGILGFAVINIYLFIDERKQRSFITDAFGQYLSPDVIEALVEDPDKLSLGGERKEMTAFFSDIQGFSTISESLTPDELVNLLNMYLTAMCDIISDQNGTIDKFEGDAIIAFWGAPIDQPNHAELSCFATIDMQNALVDLREQWIKDGLPQVLVRMGVNSGPMVVGNMGSQSRMDYTIMGDSVNLAARLEGANKFYKNFSMISEFTYALAKDAIDVRELDTIRVVGKNEPITVYDLLERKNKTTGKKAELVEIYNKGLRLYKDRNYGEAIKVFESGLELISNDGPSITYINRCKSFIENPPEDSWDGVYTHTEKG